jgi:hypothetical protein
MSGALSGLSGADSRPDIPGPKITASQLQMVIGMAGYKNFLTFRFINLKYIRGYTNGSWNSGNGLLIQFRRPQSMQTRRKFLQDCSLAVVASSLVPSAALALNAVPRAGGLKQPGFEQFVRQVNTPFFAQAGPQLVRLVLAGASTIAAASPDTEDAGNEKFSLRFVGPAQSPLGQDTYRLDHRRLGRLTIFMVPVGSLDATQCHYEAIFDRPVDAAGLALQLSLAPRRIQNG